MSIFPQKISTISLDGMKNESDGFDGHNVIKAPLKGIEGLFLGRVLLCVEVDKSLGLNAHFCHWPRTV